MHSAYGRVNTIHGHFRKTQHASSSFTETRRLEEGAEPKERLTEGEMVKDIGQMDESAGHRPRLAFLQNQGDWQ